MDDVSALRNKSINRSENSNPTKNAELKKTKQKQQEQVRDEKKTHIAAMNELREQQTKQLNNEKSAHQTRIEKQREQQQRSYLKAIEERTRQEALVRHEQKQSLGEKQKEYEKTNYEFLEKMKDQNILQKDDFYRVHELGAKMKDESALYQVALKVPEHELKNIKVHVQPDRITVSGARKFEQELQYEGEKIATNNYQTVHQEFKLPVPADKDLVRREYIDGVLLVTAPKKGIGIF